MTDENEQPDVPNASKMSKSDNNYVNSGRTLSQFLKILNLNGFKLFRKIGGAS